MTTIVNGYTITRESASALPANVASKYPSGSFFALHLDVDTVTIFPTIEEATAHAEKLPKKISDRVLFSSIDM